MKKPWQTSRVALTLSDEEFLSLYQIANDPTSTVGRLQREPRSLFVNYPESPEDSKPSGDHLSI